MNIAEYSKFSAIDLQNAVRQKQFSADEVAKLAKQAADKLNPSINAIVEYCDGDTASVPQDSATNALLSGVPIVYKDNMNLTGTHTTCGSRMLKDYRSPYTATCVQKCLDAGALSLGKANMDEFAFGSSTETSVFGPTKNPWNTNCVPGGSSGGSAAAVAAGIVPVALGSDTGGSIRQPASFCGVVGFKPSYGVVSRYGVVAFGSSLDQVGPFARNVADAALVMDVIAGRDALDCTSQEITTNYSEIAGRTGSDPNVSNQSNLGSDPNSLKGKKIGIVPTFMNDKGLSLEVKEVIDHAIKTAEELGAEIIELELPNAQAAIAAYYVLGPCEAFSNLSRFDSVRYGYQANSAQSLDEQYKLSRSQGFGTEATRRIMLGSYLLSSGVYDKYYYPAQQIRTLITQDYKQAFEHVDVIFAPTCPTTAFKLGEVQDNVSMYLSDMFTISINIAGNGGMSLPAGFGAQSGLPVGLQIIGPQLQDYKIFEVAVPLEQALQVNTLAKLGEFE